VGEVKTDDVFRQFRDRFGKSAELYSRALSHFPEGVTHAGRYLEPFPVYAERAKGSHKWTVEGHELIDYWMGHGALVLGHLHPEVEAAVHEQLSRGTHYGACHELEIEWAELIKKLSPCAEKVRFTSSGTEATQMALRLARTFTGRKKILKFLGHFHGWQDNVAVGTQPPFPDSRAAGVPEDLTRNTLAIPANDPELLDRTLAEDDDIACVILEPTGASYGRVPLKPGFLREVREITRRRGVLLIFDEVVTGFRIAPGGAQEAFGVTPDLATFGKVVAGGLPGAAVAGRADIMEILAYHICEKDAIRHPGTYNANPLSASAGVATLKLIADGELIARANERAQQLRDGMAQIVKKRGVPWRVYGDFSFAHILVYDDAVEGDEIWRGNQERLKQGGPERTKYAFRCAMLLNGVDFFGLVAILSSAHTTEDIEKTIEAFDNALEMLFEQ